MKAFIYSLITCITFCVSHAYADNNDKKKPRAESGFFYGAFVGYTQEIYKGIDSDIMVLPAVGYRGEKLNILGPRISYQLFKINNIEVNTLLQYRFAGYDASDSSFFTGMEDRDSSLDIGVSASYKKNDWSSSSNVLFDTLGRSNGSELSTRLGKTFYFGPLFIEPHVGLQYWDKQFVDYYYGVTTSEQRTDRSAYNGKHAFNKKVGLSFSTPIFFGGFTRLGIEHTWYDAVISKSPLTESDKSVQARFTFTRFF